MTDQPDAAHRLITQGRSLEDDSWHQLAVIHHDDGSWLIDGDEFPLQLTAADMAALAEAILARARQTPH